MIKCPVCGRAERDDNEQKFFMIRHAQFWQEPGETWDVPRSTDDVAVSTEVEGVYCPDCEFEGRPELFGVNNYQLLEVERDPEGNYWLLGLTFEAGNLNIEGRAKYVDKAKGEQYRMVSIILQAESKGDLCEALVSKDYDVVRAAKRKLQELEGG